MTDQNSLQALEELERSSGRIVGLLNQLDQEMNQVDTLITNFNGAHAANEHHSVHIAAALRELHTTLNAVTEMHNRYVGQIQAARDEAANRPDDDNPYN
ncbi:MAG TPA: hypothetical protein VFH56_12985 [Acidimicrobiales bacterium]|nr:hypothetical protein [Acidimicrobiales bacterium]